MRAHPHLFDENLRLEDLHWILILVAQAPSPVQMFVAWSKFAPATVCAFHPEQVQKSTLGRSSRDACSAFRT